MPKIWQKMKKSLVQLALKTHFSYSGYPKIQIWVPKYSAHRSDNASIIFSDHNIIWRLTILTRDFWILNWWYTTYNIFLVEISWLQRTNHSVFSYGGIQMYEIVDISKPTFFGFFQNHFFTSENKIIIN